MKKYLLSAASMLAFVTMSHAETYQATTWLEPGHILTEYAYVPYLKAIKETTKDKVDFELYTSGSLVPAQTTLGAVGDGVAQMGLVAAAYTPSELPLTGMINDLAFTSTDPMATALAFTQIALTNQRMRDEFANHNTVVLGAYSTPSYLFACTSDVTNLANIRGKKIRTAGTAQNEWIASVGGVPVAVPSTDIYSGLERGSIDCTLGDATNLENGPKFGEVTKAVTLLDQGTSTGLSFVVNKDFWKEIGPETRREILNDTAHAVALTQINYEGAVNDSLEKTRARGTKFNEPEKDLIDALADFRGKVIETFPKRTEKDRGVADPTDVATEFLALQQEWHDELGKIDRNDVDALTALINERIFSKVDADSYGL